MTVKAGIYVRISQDRAGAGLGVARQEEDCRALAERLGWDVAEVYVDNDTSAYGKTKKKRKGYERLLVDIGSGLIGGVLVWHTDRLHRSPAELEHYIALCEAHSVVTQTVKAGEIELTTATGRMLARMLGIIARKDVEQQAERLARTHLQSAQAGKWRGGTRPFGYDVDGVTVIDDEAAIVQKLTVAVIAGESLYSLVRWLNTQCTTTVGNPWSYVTLRQMLLRPRNAGWSEYRGQLVARGGWDPLVSEEEWQAVRAVLHAPGRRTPGSNRVKWLLSGIAECGIDGCGELLRVAYVDYSRARGRRRIYRCPGPGHVNRDAGAVDEMVTGAILALVGSDTFRSGMAARMAGDGELERLRAEQTGLLENQQLIERDAGNAGFDLAQVARMNATIRTRLAEVADRLAEVGRGAGPLGPLLAADDPEALWESFTVPQRRAAVQAAMRVVVLPKPPHHPGGNRFDPGLVRILPVTTGR